MVAAGYKNTLGRRHFVGENFSVTSPKFQMSNWASVGLHTNTRYDVYIYIHMDITYIYIYSRAKSDEFHFFAPEATVDA